MDFPEKNKAQAILKDYCQAYSLRDLNKVLSLFTQNCSVWGTGVDEYRVGLKQIEEQHLRDWAQSEKGKIEIVSLSSTPNEAPFVAAIFRATVTIASQTHVFEELRGTIVIHKEAEEWKIAHMHASFPDYRNLEGNSFPTT
jgi:ketosteroid isomerase-like protein